jgi:flagellar basal body-associated protein FliL
MEETHELEPIPPKKSWWRETSTLVGVAGVVATVAVGLVTYWLTSQSVSREYQERLKAARNDVLTAVGRSLGEGVVPNKDKIQSVISSVRRQYGIKEQDFEKPDTVIEDVLARVLANEFLDAKRREELSTQLLTLKNEPAPQERAPSVPWTTRAPSDVEAPVALSLAMAAATAIVAAFVFRKSTRPGRLRSAAREPEFVLEQVLFPMLAVLALLLALAFVLSKSPAVDALRKGFLSR